MAEGLRPGLSRRDLLSMIGVAAGGAAMYQAMTTLGHAEESPYAGPINLQGAPQGAKILVLGAGLAGMTAALELRAAGYAVEVLEFREKAGGRCWTLRGGDRYEELGGAVQEVKFSEGNYLNPGPWRIPYHHHAVLDYCRRLGVQLEPFVQLNHNAYLHGKDAFGGKPQRFRHISTDFRGHVSELLAKAVNQKALDQAVTPEDQEMLLAALKRWGVLDDSYAYVKSLETSHYRGFERDPGGGLSAVPVPSEPLNPSDLLQSGLWRYFNTANNYEFQTTMFQPVGGMDMIAQAFQRETQDLIRFNAKVLEIRQGEDGVTVTYEDRGDPGKPLTATADWCVCTIPFSVLSQIPGDFSGTMRGAIDQLPYDASVKVGLEFKRRFWEEDEHIYGGISFTDLPITLISYPSTGYHKPGPAVLLGTYSWGAYAYEFTSMSPEERIEAALGFGARIHPQYRDEFLTGAAVGWHRVPWTLGCYGMWTEEKRAEHYDNACAIDGRIVMAGEHISYIPAWMEGAILSSLDAIGRLHTRIVAG